VLCLDQSGHEPAGGPATNVARLHALLEHGPRQAVFYDREAGAWARSARALDGARPRWLDRGLGVAFGLGFTQELESAYRFLIETHAPGDRVYLFGCGPGAYTVRALAALLYKCGLLREDRHALVAQALKLFKYEERPRLHAGFRRTFSRRVTVRLLGLFDPLASPGRVYDLLGLPFLQRNPRVEVVRLALALDERRAWLRPGPWGPALRRQDVRQLWFAGEHADVGGALPEGQDAPSSPALFWMLDEARRHGLLIDEPRYAESLRAWPPEALGPLQVSPRALGCRRRPPERALVHRSVARRLADPALGYAPSNLLRPVFVDA